MDEQLEQQIEGRGAEAQLEEAVLSPAGEAGTAEEKATETERWEEVKEATTRGEASPDARKETAAYATTASSEQKDEGGEAPAETVEGTSPAGEIPLRDHYAEWRELAEAHPEVVGKELPEDIYQACMQSELPPLRIYESMMLQKQAEQIAVLEQEIVTLRQNAENTARAPVSGAAGGPDSEPEDLFLKGFYSY